MKKWFAFLLTCCLLCGALTPLCAAQAETNVISLRLNSDIAGCTREDAEKLLEIRSGHVVYYSGAGGAVAIANAAGGTEGAHMDAGRTYAITYTLAAEEGYALPETLADGDVLLETGEGVTVLSCGVIELANVNVPPAFTAARTRVLRITARVRVDGTVLQRIIGLIRDLLLKLRSWQLY